MPGEVELAETAFLYPGVTVVGTAAARGQLRLSKGRLSYSIADQPPDKVVKWLERTTGQPDLAERLRDWSGPVEVLDVAVADVKWKISWTTTWNLLKLKVGDAKWRIRFTPAKTAINAEELRGGKIGRRWRKALREAA